ncbi:hypothetical protein HDK77DRAFT_448660 [Phyllosticta capitalensis]
MTDIPVARCEGRKTRSMTRASLSATRQQSTPGNNYVPRVAIHFLEPSQAHPQQQSPLWGKLPAEIRNQIFELAVSQHFDETREYPVGSYYRRPGYTHAFKVCTALLQTCRLAWLEAHSIPMRSATIPIWEHQERGPPKWLRPYNYSRIMLWGGRGHSSSLTAANRLDLDHVHFFTQLVYLEDGSPNRLFRKRHFNPRRVTITIRHTDWWNWEDDHDLDLSDFDLFLPNTTEQLVIEFETIVRKKPQLDPIVAHWRGKTFKRMDDAVFSTVGEPTEYRWSGELDDYGPQDYVVVVVTWKPAQTRR